MCKCSLCEDSSVRMRTVRAISLHEYSSVSSAPYLPCSSLYKEDLFPLNKNQLVLLRQKESVQFQFLPLVHPLTLKSLAIVLLGYWPVYSLCIHLHCVFGSERILTCLYQVLEQRLLCFKFLKSSSSTSSPSEAPQTLSASIPPSFWQSPSRSPV